MKDFSVICKIYYCVPIIHGKICLTSCYYATSAYSIKLGLKIQRYVYNYIIVKGVLCRYKKIL